MKSVTFKVSKSGVYHYKDLRINDNGMVDPQLILFCYSSKQSCPVIKKESTVEEVLSLLKTFAFNKNASIYKKDHLPVLVKQDVLDNVDIIVENIEDTIKKEVNKLFKNHLNKILGKYKIDFLEILIEKNGEYVNLSNDEDKHYAINYVCHRLLYRLGKEKNDRFDSETGYISNYFDYFINDIEDNK